MRRLALAHGMGLVMDSEPLARGDLKSADMRVALEALRDELADALETCSVGVKAQIAAQYRATLKEIAELPPVEGMSPIDQLAARRRNRLAAADAAASSG